jgi:hypothetical protein
MTEFLITRGSMVISIKDYEKSSTYKFIKDVIEVTKPLNKLSIVYFIYEYMEN